MKKNFPSRLLSSKCLKTILVFCTIINNSLIFSQTISTWTTNSTSNTWLTSGNWSSNVIPSATNIVQFGSAYTSATSGSGGIGINMNGSTNNGSNAQACAAIEVTSAKTSGSVLIGNSSTTKSGTLTLNGATITGTNNVILHNLSSQNLILQDVAGSGSMLMNIALGNSIDNKIILDGTGNITISSIIQGTNKPLTFMGTNTTGAITISGNNTFSGSSITFFGAETIFSSDAGLGAIPGTTLANALIVDGGRFTMTGSYTLNSKRGIQVGNTTGSSISIKSSGSVITYNGIITNKTSVIGDLVKQGAGTLILGGLNTYSGLTAINNGIIQLGINNSFPTTTSLSIGQSNSTNTGTLNLAGFSQTVAGITVNTNIGTISSKNTITSSSSSTLTINAVNNYTYGLGTSVSSGIISGAVSIVKNGTGIQAFGDANTYLGSTTINSGTLQICPMGTVTAVNTGSSNLILNGGVLSTEGINTSSSVTFSTLTLSDNSIINLNTINNHTLSIATSSTSLWTSTKTLTITGWQGNYCGSGTATKGKITVGTNSLSLTSSQLAQILFFDGTNYYPAKLSTTGELIPNGFPFISAAASSNSPLCSGNNLSLSFTAKGTPAPTYSWSGPNSFSSNVQSPSISNVSILSTGIYSATATNTCGIVTSTVLITVNATPTLSAINNISTCPNKLANTSFTSIPTGSSFNWSNNNTNIGLTSSGTGSISFTTSLIASNQTAILTVTPQLNSCVGLSQSFSITVNGNPSASIWTGAVSSDWFYSDNWSNCVCGSATNATITSVTSPSFNPIISGSQAAKVNNIEINANANLSIQSTQTLNINGDFINNGSFSSGQGLVDLSGSTIQNIWGVNPINFYDLQLDNSTGAVLNNTVGIYSSLNLNSGSLTTNGKLTLLAGTNQTGRIAAISANADIIGNVNVQQIAKGGSTGWALLGAPVTSNITMADWNDNFAITCASCPNGSQSGFTSIYAYSETAVGSFSTSSKYLPITSITNPINNGQGYWVYLGNGNTSTTDILFDVTGTVAKSSCLTCTNSIKIPITYSNYNTSSSDNGWNLIANPLPSPISWSALRNGNVNVDDAIYAYNTDLLNGTGAFTSYVNGVSSDLAGGIGDAIPMCQAFYIHATASTTLNATENVKTNSNQVLLKNSQLTVKPIVRLIMDGGSTNLSDMTTFYFEAGATNLFEKNYDAYKLINDPTLPYIASISSNELMSINGLPDFTSNITVPIKAMTSTSQSYTFSILKSDFPSTVCINLYDSFTGISTNLSNSNYSCMLYDTTQTNRFTINFTTLPLSGTTISNQPVCSAPNSGNIIAVGNNSGPWDFEWRDSNNTIVKTSYNKPIADTLKALSSGNYSVKINTTGQCDLYSNNISINQIVIPFANFTTNTDTIYLSNNTQFLITNNSLNCNTYDWNFGDLTPNDNSISPYHIYTTAGTFSITLITESISNCIDSTKNKVVVINDITNTKDISELEKSYSLFYYQNSSSYCLKINLKENSSIDIKILDISGQLIIVDKLLNIKNKNYVFNLEDKADGIYFLQVTSNRGDINSFKLKK